MQFRHLIIYKQNTSVSNLLIVIARLMTFLDKLNGYETEGLCERDISSLCRLI